MFDNNDLPNGGVQFAISHEVITFLRWLTENHPTKLQELTKLALNDGLLKKTQLAHELCMEDEETQATILDFFGTLEIIMHEALEEYAASKAHQNRLQNTIDQIDGTFCDTGTVKTSLENATTSLAMNPEKSPKELLFTEILKQWRPNNSQPLN